MSADIICLATVRKARQQASAVPQCLFLLPAQVAAFYAETWLAALRRIESELPKWPGYER